jgi:hypothetical protein
MVTMIVEFWRFSKVFFHLLDKVDQIEKTRYINQFRWFSKKIDESMLQAGMKIINIEGQQFEPGMAATPLNINEFNDNDILYVEKMIEPIIIGQNGLIRTGTVILMKVKI